MVAWGCPFQQFAIFIVRVPRIVRKHGGTLERSHEVGFQFLSVLPQCVLEAVLGLIGGDEAIKLGLLHLLAIFLLLVHNVFLEVFFRDVAKFPGRATVFLDLVADGIPLPQNLAVALERVLAQGEVFASERRVLERRRNRLLGIELKPSRIKVRYDALPG